MNTFVTFEVVALLEQASIYTVKINSDDNKNESTEYDKFLVKAEDEPTLRSDLEEIKAQLAVIGNRGTGTFQFRQENKALALPSKDKRLVSVDFVPAEDQKLRLYFILLPDDVMVLCNGGGKTRQEAQKCPQVAPHFKFANRLASLLEKRLEEEPKPLGYERIEYILNHETIML